MSRDATAFIRGIVNPNTPTAQKESKPTRILLVDDHPMVRERLTEIIEGEADLTVCGEAEDRHQALDKIKATRPDLVTVDITLKNSAGLDLIKDIHSRWPKLHVLVISMHDESLYAERVIRAGARGFITKQEATRSVLVAIRRVLEGQIYLNQKVASRILGQLATPSGDKPGRTPAELLTDRELQVFELTGRGLNTRQIAERLHIGAKTAETYRTRIREKLGLEDPAALLQVAIAWTHDR